MDKELIDRVWKYHLPKAFKEGVKELYKHENKVLAPIDGVTTLNEIFGHHNLTSDAEGEDEMLCVSRKKIQEAYRQNKEEINRENVSSSDRDCYETVNEVLKTLFGSKCLPDEVDNLENKLRFGIGDVIVFHPFKTDSFYDAKLIDIKEGEDKPYLIQLGDKREIWAYPIEVQSIAETYPPKERICDNPLADKEGCKHCNNGRCSFDSACYFEPLNPQEPKPAEQKFKKGEMVRYRYDGKLYIVECKTGKYHYALRQHDSNIMMHDVLGSDLEPYTEPSKGESVNLHAESVETLRIASEESHLRNLSQETANCDKHSNNTLTDTRNAEIDHFVVKDEMVDNIIKSGFKNHNRLHIAAMMAAAILSSPGSTTSNGKIVSKTPGNVAETSFAYADALIEKSEKGGSK